MEYQTIFILCVVLFIGQHQIDQKRSYSLTIAFNSSTFNQVIKFTLTRYKHMARTSSKLPKKNKRSSKNRRNRRNENPDPSNNAEDAVVIPTIEHEKQEESQVLVNSNSVALEEPADMPCLTEEASDIEQTYEPKEETRTKKPTKRQGSRKPSREVERLTTVSSSQSQADKQSADVDSPARQAQQLLLQYTTGYNNYDQDHNLNDQSIRPYDYYTTIEQYQRKFQFMQRSNMIAQMNNLIRKLPKQHDGIKIWLRSLQDGEQLDQKTTILKAVETSDQCSLQEKLISGQRACIITKAEEFYPLSLKDNAFSTHFCFIQADSKHVIFVDCLKDMKIPAFTTQEWDTVVPLDDGAPLRPNEYYMIDLGPVVSTLRQYSAVVNCKDNSLMQQITTNQIKHELHQKRPFANKEDFFTPQGRQSRIKLNSQQAYIVQAIGRRKKGISLIQGLPGTGKTEIILEIAQNQMFQIRKGEAKLPRQEKQKDKIMICATSNAVADNIHKKLLKRTADWENPPKILRVCHAEQIDEMHLSSNYHHQREIRLLGTQKEQDEWTVTLRWKKKQSEERIKRLRARGQRSRNAIRRERKIIEKIQEKIVGINQKMSKQRYRLEKIERGLMEESDIIICTINITGMKKIVDFYRNRVRCLLIDQANQATETCTLIPFATLVEKVVLVGNKYLLRPTTKTKLKAYKRSLFERLSAKNDPFILQDQYRMTREIMEFPNRQFCKEKLTCMRSPDVPSSLSALKHKFKFCDVTYGVEKACQMDFTNREEAECILTMIEELTERDENLTIGVIAAYKQQVKLIQSQIFFLDLEENLRKNVHVGTIEAFQGLQMDVVIFSTVRSNSQQQIGALHVRKRLNLAFTRAKSALFVFGSPKTLCGNKTWRSFLGQHKASGSFQTIKKEESKNFFAKL